MMPKSRQPTHPGVILNDEFLLPLELTPKQFAKELGGDWNELKVNALLSKKENVSEKIAQDFAKFFETSAEFWRSLQQRYNDWESTYERDKKTLKSWKKAQ